MDAVTRTVVFTGELFRWGDGGWHFVRLPAAAAGEVREVFEDVWFGPPRGFGSVKVQARIGGSTWETSVFPEKDSGSFVLPVKKAVRVAEGIAADDMVHVQLEIEPGIEEETP